MENEETKRAVIIHALRMLWLHSRERAAALKREKYICQTCGVKQSKKKGHEQKIEVHHLEGIGNWDRVVEIIREEILCDTDKLKVVCPDCHEKEEA
ncbi:MAG: hypothetical protein KKD18_06650 [Nanoarchaeota archaeon]|nr:hypothetical protein [Nanoarchaeota archaeon]